MVRIKCGGQTRDLVSSDELIALKMARGVAAAARPVAPKARAALDQIEPAYEFDTDEMGVFRSRDGDAKAVRDTLKADEAVDFAGRVLVDPETKEPALYTEAVFIRFEDEAPEAEVRHFLANRTGAMAVARRFPFARHTYLLHPRERIGQRVFDEALELLEKDLVCRCHPELLHRKSDRTLAPRPWPDQWHLGDRTIGGASIAAHAFVEAAWATTRGEGATIAIVDDGVEVTHPEFQRPGKIVAPVDVTLRVPDGSHKLPGDKHGTACAGVACADGTLGAAGVAPEARLMPVRLRSPLGSVEEAEAIYWAAANGADVISCSWGPVGGQWNNPHDPRHQLVTLLSDMTAAAIEAATRYGRLGRGCVVTWAAGNSNDRVDLDGYPANPDVMAIAACNDRGLRSAYSDFGQAISCAFPSNDFIASQTRGIWTTDRAGFFGYNPQNPQVGDADGLFSATFGGTSSACPGVAGVAALVMAANSVLTGAEARAAIEDTCDRIDEANGAYDANGHSPYYGRGRVNAGAAVASVGAGPLVG